ncbi:DUF4175 domain-containing protein [Pseudoxanthomonas sp. CF125]|uniref:DUF4175 domain-containing protein n=1 Tax=Pseudoxanthomonas sp. CF125 TaxID=1855303 RepID=UPI0008840889|nr:DUF4175 domain-containing protein [Pseudoxanthomonas sp. CF125]SDR15291.1 hypothetical protein SAMN05216569_3371 [Pseudoxanthomonas sp. CF125]
MIANKLPRLSQPARMRSLADDLLLWSPLPLLLAAAAWRWQNTLAALLVGVAGFFLLTVFAWQRARRFDRQWLIRQLDAQRADMEDSTDLLFAEDARLNPLQRLQRARLQQRLAEHRTPDLRPAWSSSRIAASWIAGALAVATLVFWPARQSTTVLAPSAENLPVVAGVPRLVGQRLRITPPAYTGLPARDEASLDAKAPQGSHLRWTLHFEPQPIAADLAFHDGTRAALTRDGEDWSVARSLDKSVLYRVSPSGAEHQPAPPLHRLDAISDAPPQVKVLVPERSLSLVTPGQRNWALSFEVSDDYGVAANAQLRITLAQGEGENITFRERTLDLRGTGTGKLKRFSPQLDLAALGFSTGDDLIAQLTVADNRAPRPQTVRSPSLILRWPSDLGAESTGLEGMVKKVMPAYFRSQRQIIIDAEALLKEQRKLDTERFAARSDAIGVDQRILRLRYGQFLGEEAEGGARPPPTNDAETHDDDHAQTQAEAATQDEHDHAPASEEAKPAFGADADVLVEFGHTHDHAEAATLLDPETRATLKQALDQMWQSELHLRQGHPRQALPYAYKALGFIKQVQQATRIFLARVGPELPPIDEARRMTGDRAGLARRELPLAAKNTGIDAAPAEVWRALADSPHAAKTTELPLDALERWLRANEARVSDPLAFVSAIDAVRRDPSCIECRRDLRGLLWTVLPRPPANVLRRSDEGADGRRYLEALGQETRP